MSAILRHDPGPGFRALHVPGRPFILANAWDAGSARVLAGLNASAIGTTSAGHAFTLGRDDGQITRDEALSHAADLVAATPLPVSADLENGFADAPEGVAETVRLAAEAGVAGLSIEDVRTAAGPAYPRDEALARVEAGIAAARALPRDVVFCARADGVMTGAYDLVEACARIAAFADLGADVVYVPLPGDGNALERVVRAASGRPVNALAVGPLARLGMNGLAALGAARISLGSALARMTHRVLIDAGIEILTEGSFTSHKLVGGDAVGALMSAGRDSATPPAR
ncbi:MAG: isocitrate lyase/phosphoenolpyruvate mutase family protein [Pseudomonadota bacterium]